MLRWDEGIRWALVVGTNLLKTIPRIGEGVYRFVIGGSEPGLPRCTFIPGTSSACLVAKRSTRLHIFRVRRDGGIAVPPPTQRPEKTRITRFELLRREVLVMVIVAAVLLLFSLIVSAPIDNRFRVRIP